MDREHVRVLVDRGEGNGSLLYQLYLIAGSLILAGTALGYYLHPVFYSLPATAGVMMIVTGFRGNRTVSSIGTENWNKPSEWRGAR
jgi:hypothetical protein